jgi:hypothetical protein
MILIGPTAGLLIPVLTTGTTNKVLTAVLGLLVGAAAALKSGLTVPWKKAGPAILILGALTMTGCPKNANTTAWKVTAGTMYAFKATSKGLATAPGVTCKQLRFYRDNIRPAGRSSVGAAYAGIRISDEVKKPNVTYPNALKPGGCLLILGLREWGHKLPDKGASIMPFLSVFSGAVCDKVEKPTPKSAAAVAIITALLPVAVDLVKWVITLVNADDSKLQREINTWIMGPAADEVDARIKAECGGGA